MRALAIVGPTASGKTDLSIPVALRIGAEVVSVDSRQLYRGMDIGTAKVEVELRRRVPHHGIDVVDPGERYSAGRFAGDARRWIAEIEARGRVPLLVGGTGFFLRTLTHPVFEEPPIDAARRARLRDWLRDRTREELARWARVLDPERADLAEAGGRQRLSRTVEVPLLTGRTLGWWHRASPSSEAPTAVATVLLEWPREVLYARIDARVAGMFAAGFAAEAERLLAGGIDESAPGASATGYREAFRLARGEIDEEEAMEGVRKATRALARRQITWFRHQLTGEVLRLDATRPLATQVEEVARWWDGIGGPGEG